MLSAAADKCNSRLMASSASPTTRDDDDTNKNNDNTAIVGVVTTLFVVVVAATAVVVLVRRRRRRTRRARSATTRNCADTIGTVLVQWRRFPRYGWTSKNYVICVCFHCHGTSSYHTTNTLQGRRAKSHADTQTIQPGLGDFVL